MFATPPPALSALREVIGRSYAASDLMAARAPHIAEAIWLNTVLI